MGFCRFAFVYSFSINIQSFSFCIVYLDMVFMN